MARFSILGAGAWGCALASILKKNHHDILIWNHQEKNGLAWESTTDLHRVFAFSDMFIMAIPAQSMREVGYRLQKCGSPKACIIASKGLESDTGYLMGEVLREIFPKVTLAALGGPHCAREVSQGLPFGMTFGTDATSGSFQRDLQDGFSLPFIALEFTRDLIGVQVMGALKNIMAIGYGLLQQASSCENLRATYCVLAMREMIRVNVALGGYYDTAMTFAGWGDFILTNHVGRNSQYGRQFPQEPSSLVEGRYTLSALLKRMQESSIVCPIVESIARVLAREITLSHWVEHFQDLFHVMDDSGSI